MAISKIGLSSTSQSSTSQRIRHNLKFQCDSKTCNKIDITHIAQRLLLPEEILNRHQDAEEQSLLRLMILARLMDIMIALEEINPQSYSVKTSPSLVVHPSDNRTDNSGSAAN